MTMKKYSIMAVIILLNSFCIEQAQSRESAKIDDLDTRKNNQLVVTARDKDEDGWWHDQS
ncbi:MAG TPA: hypothetical protein DDY32_11125 [Desulfobulbaceae bacterium]|nr:hypothetical protein [Desulfobulbaceae bacterium]